MLMLLIECSQLSKTFLNRQRIGVFMQMLCKGLVVQARSRYGRLMLARVHLPPQPNRCITAAPMIIAIIIALVKSIFSSLDNFLPQSALYYVAGSM